jgi:uncharacterized protein (DUF1501 family)
VILMKGPRLATRREMLLASGALFAWAYKPWLAHAEGRDPRFLVIVLRGALDGLDGLATVAPVGDPNWVRLRGNDALLTSGETAALPLNNFFALNPAMPNLYRMYKAGQATIVHAVASPYRERSHFDGQDVLESGLTKPGGDTGWLNRALAGLKPSDRIGGKDTFAVGPITPLIARGSAPVLSWTPSRLQPAGSDTLGRLLDLYRHTDPVLARALEERNALAAIASEGTDDPGRGPKPGGPLLAYFTEAASGAARFMARPDGPRVGALAFDGWDTHANEGATHGRLSVLLGALDSALAAIESGMGAGWKETAVAGGALKGGRVIADWPGVADAALYQGRDLKPTADLRAVMKGILRDHLRADERALAQHVFPDSETLKSLDGLIA